MLEIKWQGIEFDMSSGKEEPIPRFSGLVGQTEETLKELIMRDAMIQARKDGHRLIRITGITITLDQELEPERFPELAFV